MKIKKIITNRQTGSTLIKYIPILMFSLLFIVPDAFARINDSTQKAWEKTKEFTNDAINVSKEAGEKALDASKDAYTAFSDPSSNRQTPEERFNEIWGDVLEHLNDGLDILHKSKGAPDSAIFIEDKKSLRADFNEILDEIIVLLDDPNIQDDRDQIDSLLNQIKETKYEISEYREKRVAAPREHMVKTTKSGYDKKIKEAEQDIIRFQNQIEKIHLRLLERFRDIGLDLDLNQMTVLLSRVDAENIIQMSAVFDELKRITKQLMELTQSSGEDIETAKKYYGMQVILTETAIYMQNKYIEKINNEFLPKLEEITTQTLLLHQKTQKQISQLSDSNKKKIYMKNVEAQELTIKVARLYMNNLKSQKEKVVTAKMKANEDLKVARNTFETVEVCADLLDLLKSSQDAFDTIMDLQIPDIVPFENLEMMEEFQRLSIKMQKSK